MKYCTSCNQNKDLTEFNKNKAKFDGLQTKCKLCDRNRARKLYNNDPECANKAIARKAIRIKDNKQKLLKILINSSCVICLEKDIVVLDFDHLDRSIKIDNVSNMVCQGLSWLKIEEEIKKCQILCANCHRRKTAKDLNLWRYNSLLPMW